MTPKKGGQRWTTRLYGKMEEETSYLVPLAICAVDSLDELGIVQVEKVGADANHRAELLV